MFDQILEMVKNHIGESQNAANAIPSAQADAVHKEIAAHINDGVREQAAAQGGLGGLLSSLTNHVDLNNPATSAIAGGLIGALGNKFGLSSTATGAIAAALPGLLQKFAHKANDPNDLSITPENIM